MNGSKYDLFSLFSGAGGMDAGFKLSNDFDQLFANDILHSPALTYKKNFHHHIAEIGKDILTSEDLPAYLVGNVSDIDFESIKKDDLDLIIGGPPCQDFSIVRGPEKERQGIDVQRGKLYSHFIRALIHLQPKIFVFENVPGLKNANKGLAFEKILEDFTNLNLRWDEICKTVGNCFDGNSKNYKLLFHKIVDSADLGIPQRRRRLIIIGVKEDLLQNNSIVTEDFLKKKIEKMLAGHESLLWKYPLTPLEVFEGLPLTKLDKKYKQIMKEYKDIPEISKTEKAKKWKKEVFDRLSFSGLEDYYMINDIIPKDENEVSHAFNEHIEILKKLGYYKNNVETKKFSDKSNMIPEDSESVTARMNMIPFDENHEFVRGTEWEVEGRGMSLIYRRLHPLKPAYTVVAYGGGGTWGYHYKRSRGKLSNRERARLQSFPDWFKFVGNNSEVRAQIGEAVPPLLGEKIASVAKIILEGIKV